MKIYRKNDRGVTVLELLIVITIIGIIAAISVPNVVGILRNHRTRAGAMTLLNAIRKERSRALSLNREVVMTVDTVNETYDVKISAYTLYSPLSIALNDPKAILSEAQRDVIIDKGFDPKSGIESITTNLGSTTFDLTFNPSGTIQFVVASPASIELQGQNPGFGYELRIYKGGQIVLHQRTT